MQTLEEKTTAAKKQLAQAQNRLKLLENRERDAERRKRTHRLIERGAILESLIDDAVSMSNEEIKALLQAALLSKSGDERDSLV